MDENQHDKRFIGLIGEMHLSMELHQRGWQVYRAYIDEHIDFILARYYCMSCRKFSNLQKREKMDKKGNVLGEFPTDRCEMCGKAELEFIVRFMQVKASAGIPHKSRDDIRQYSFHAKLRSNVDDRSFYAWLAFWNVTMKPYIFLFNHRDIAKFDDLSLDSYQKTDNQKITLKINSEGEVLNKSTKYDFSCFNEEFRDSFGILEWLTEREARNF